MELEEIMLKVEELEDDNIALKDFVFDKICRFEESMKDMKRQKDEDMKDLREEVSNLSKIFDTTPPASEARPTTPTTSTPKPTVQVLIDSPKNASLPSDLGDLDQEMQSRLKPFWPKNTQPKDKMAKLQLAYVFYWMDTNECKGKSP